MNIPSRRFWTAAATVPALLLISACGSTSAEHVRSESATNLIARAPGPALIEGSTSTARSAGVGASSGAAAGAPVTSSLDSVQAARDPLSQSTVGAQSADVISHGQVSLRTKDIDKTAFQLQKLLDGWNGTIASENADADKSGRTIRERLVLRVPSARFGDVMEALPRLGTLVDQSRTSQDVTTAVINNNVRVRTQRLSIDRIQALLARATDINQIIAIEGQLSRRQANLDSLTQQQTDLANQTALATIDVYLTVPPEKLHRQSPAKHHHGFLHGLGTGWRHLGSSTTAILGAIGTALPFAAVLAIVALPFWVRRRRSV